jgi:hypothetical protein
MAIIAELGYAGLCSLGTMNAHRCKDVAKLIATSFAQIHTTDKNFLMQSVTRHKTWVLHFELQSMWQLMVWCHTTSPVKKFKTVPPAGGG